MTSNRAKSSSQTTVPVDVVRDLLHDLGGPLIAAQGFLSLLERAPAGPSAPRYAQALRESIASMHELIEKTKEVYRAKEGS